MAVEILEVKRESWPATRFIGKKYKSKPNWGEWWQNDWFAILESKERLSFNGDAYIGAVHMVNGMPEYWIGMFFHTDTTVPDGFESVDIGPLEYAVCYLYDKENSGDFYTADTRNMCLETLGTLGLKHREDDWCFERYNCPRFTTPDEKGNVILDYAVSIED